jgi:hypothetical protein
METRRHVSLVGPTLLIGLGLILLLNNLGYLNWGFGEMLRLWPILLIAAGLEVLLGRRSIWVSLFAAVVVLALIAGSIWIGRTVEMEDRRTDTVEIRYPLEEIETAGVRLAPAVGDLTVGALVDSADLIQGTIRLRDNERLNRRFNTGERANLVLETDNVNPAGYVGFGSANAWTLALNPNVELDLSADLGAGEVELALTDLNVDDVTVEFGLAQIDVILPAKSNATLVIDGGIGTVVLRVPEGVGVRIDDDAGLVGRTLPQGFTREGDRYTSPTYAVADTQVDVTIGLGIGSIRVVPLGE